MVVTVNNSGVNFGTLSSAVTDLPREMTLQKRTMQPYVVKLNTGLRLAERC